MVKAPTAIAPSGSIWLVSNAKTKVQVHQLHRVHNRSYWPRRGPDVEEEVWTEQSSKELLQLDGMEFHDIAEARQQESEKAMTRRGGKEARRQRESEKMRKQRESEETRRQETEKAIKRENDKSTRRLRSETARKWDTENRNEITRTENGKAPKKAKKRKSESGEEATKQGDTD